MKLVALLGYFFLAKANEFDTIKIQGKISFFDSKIICIKNDELKQCFKNRSPYTELIKKFIPYEETTFIILKEDLIEGLQ